MAKGREQAVGAGFRQWEADDAEEEALRERGYTKFIPRRRITDVGIDR